MVHNSDTGLFTNLFGVKVGSPVRDTFTPSKHLESRSFDALIPKENQWLGLINVITSFKKVSSPFLSATELQKNVVYTDGPGSIFTFGVPFETGCPFIMDNFVRDNPTPGRYNEPFHIVLSENAYTYGDVITSDPRNGKQLRIQHPDDKGPEAKIISWGNGWRYLVALDGFYPKEDYYPHKFLVDGTYYVRIDNAGSTEFQYRESSVDTTGRRGVNTYQYTVGESDRNIGGWVTSDASNKRFDFNPSDGKVIPQLASLKGASAEVLNYFYLDKQGRKKGMFWVPDFIEQLTTSLMTLQERALMWQQGNVIDNGREKVRRNPGFYQQIRQRGHHSFYTTWRQLFNMFRQLGDRLYGTFNPVPLEKRHMQVRAGRIAYAEIAKQFGQFMKENNPYPIHADHPELLKAKMIQWSDKDGLVYVPLTHKTLFLPEAGWFHLELDETLTHLDESLGFVEAPQQAAYGNRSETMVIIEDITSSHFSNAIPDYLRQEGANYKNVTLIKEKGKEDSIDYIVGRQVNPTLKKMLGIHNGGVIAGRDKKLEISMGTHGEIFVQDPSKICIFEWDPDGELEYLNGFAASNMMQYQP